MAVKDIITQSIDIDVDSQKDNFDISNKKEFSILICLIEIWKCDEADPLKEPVSPRLIAEVESIDIEDTYKKLICGATVKFPRGTIMHNTLTVEDGTVFDTQHSFKVTQDGVNYGTINESRDSGRSKYENGEWITVSDNKLIEPTDFAIGDRIRIRLGYTNNPEVAALAYYNTPGKRNIYNDTECLAEYKKYLKTMFNGYITKVSLDTPIELQCENLASAFKRITCSERKGTSKDTVNMFFKGDKCFFAKEMKKVGLELYPKTAATEIKIGNIDITKDLVVADVLDQWSKRKVYTFIRREGNKYYLVVGRPYFSNVESKKFDSLLRVAEQRAETPKIDFTWNVAQNGLKLMSIDKKLIAVEAQCYRDEDGKDKFFKITVRPNPEYNPKDKESKKYQTLGEVQLTKKELKSGKQYYSSTRDGINMDSYTIIPYMSREINISTDKLVNEAIEYLEGYNPNGIDGTLTLFGDYCLTTGMKVELYDPHHSAKNGYYLIDEVKTSFGVNGFRQTIKLPYCINRHNDNKNKNVK